MSEPIKVDDMVVVIHPPKHSQTCGVGVVFRVTKIRQPNRGKKGRSWQCSVCGKSGVSKTALTALVAEGYGQRGFPLSRLKRIPPLDELEGEKRDEKLTEPA